MVTFWSQFALLKGWAEMIHEVFAVDPLVYLRCGEYSSETFFSRFVRSVKELP